MKHSLDINDWNKFIYTKKLNVINKIDKNDTLDKSSDSIKFNTILKDIAKSNIFNMSYTAFMTLKFLETSFIPSAIILNVMNIYSNDEMYKILLTEKNIEENVNYINYINYIKTIRFIIILIIDFIVTIELSLNIQCLLMTDFINKIDEHKCKNIDNDISLNNSFKPKIFKMFNKLNQNTITNIKPSTRILLIFKLLNKLGINNYIEDDNTETNYDIINFIYNINNSKVNEDNEKCENDKNENDKNENDKNETNETNEYNKTYVNYKFINYINNKKEINKKTKLYLDEFILDITKYFGLNNNNNNNNNNNIKTISISQNSYQNIYSICSNYILNNTELVFSNFENLFNILEAQLLKNLNINEERKLYYLRNVIKNIINIEIDNIKKLFCV